MAQIRLTKKHSDDPLTPDGAVPERAVLLLAHGSRCFESLDQLRQIAAAVDERQPELRVAIAFLQLSDPQADEVIERLVEQGCVEIIVVPLLLLRATHSRVDIPGVIDGARVRHPFVSFTVTNGLGPSRTLEQLAAKRIADVGGKGRPLIIVSQGTSNDLALGDVVDASVDVAKDVGAPSVVNAFARAAAPSVHDVVASLGAGDDVVVFNWVLCHGKLVEDARDVFTESPATVTDAGCFGPDPAIIDLICQRLEA